MPDQVSSSIGVVISLPPRLIVDTTEPVDTFLCWVGEKSRPRAGRLLVLNFPFLWLAIKIVPGNAFHEERELVLRLDRMMLNPT